MTARRQTPVLFLTMIIAACSRQVFGFSLPSLRQRSAKILTSSVSSSVRHNGNHHKFLSRNQVRLFSVSNTASEQLSDEQKASIEESIKAKGDEIRALKEGGAEKSAVAPLVEELLSLKGQLDPSILEAKKKKQKQPQQQPKQKQKQNQQQQKGGNNGSDDEESDFITARAVDYSKWYNDIIRVTGLAETSPVRGCMVIKPWGMSLWDRVRTELDAKIQEHGAENAYFPLLIPKSFLAKEAEHVDGFAKECAVVTHHRLTVGPEGGLIADPEAELEDPLIIRPTSETMIWFMFRKWINSHRYVQTQCFSAFSVGVRVRIDSYQTVS